ncbi:MAG: glycosyltransferase family 2 protein [Synergistaceae bacterium]|nr:glycosyltransferase family 2 protein [Synergistaceae bacterium]
MDAKPLHSVIIPTYNRKALLAEAISSVLNQTQTSLEVIVVDDCSTDGTEDFVRGMNDERVRYVRNEKNSGQEYSRMIGFRQARGKYVTFLDDDDYYTDYEFFAKAAKIFVEHENDNIPLAMVCANAKFLNVTTGESNDSNIGRPGRVKGIDYILKPEYRKPPSVFPAVFSAEALRRAGLTDMIIFDGTTYVQAAMHGDMWILSDVIGIYRIHGNNHSKGLKDHKADSARRYFIIEEEIKRRKLIRDELRRNGKSNEASKWYVSRMISQSNFYAIARPGLKDRLRTLYIILKVSGFMPKLWLKLTAHFIKNGLAHVTPLRNLWKVIRGKMN